MYNTQKFNKYHVKTMKFRIATMCALMLGASFMVHAQDYDDIYSDGNDGQTQVVTTVKQVKQNPQRVNVVDYRSGVPVRYSTTVQKNYQNERDVDEYNRRGAYDGVGLNDAYPADSTAILNEDGSFANTRRLERFYDPDVVVRSTDGELVELYYNRANTPDITIVFDGGYPYYGPTWRYGWYTSWYDPWYDPWYYDRWYTPWGYTWRTGWYGGWYGGWYAGWYGWRPYHYGWGGYYGYRGWPHHYRDHGYHYASWGRDHGRLGGGRTPGHIYHGSSSRLGGNRSTGRVGAGGSGTHRPGYATSGNLGHGSGRVGVNRTTQGVSRGSMGTSGRRPGYATGGSSPSSRGSSSWGGSRSSSRSSGYSGGSRSSGYSGGGYSGGGRSGGGFSGGGHSGGGHSGGGFSGGGGRRR